MIQLQGTLNGEEFSRDVAAVNVVKDGRFGKAKFDLKSYLMDLAMKDKIPMGTLQEYNSQIECMNSDDMNCLKRELEAKYGR